MRIRHLSLVTVPVTVALVSGCAARQTRVTEPVEAIQAQAEVAEKDLLDVTIVVFDPGLAGMDELQLNEKGIFPDVRKSEARFIPVHLMRTLQATGHWGAVRVMPSDTASDLTVLGQIERSNGKDLELEDPGAGRHGRGVAGADLPRAGQRPGLRPGAGRSAGAVSGPLQPDRQRHPGGARSPQARGAPEGAPGRPAALRSRSRSTGARQLPEHGCQGPCRGRATAGRGRSDAGPHRPHPRAGRAVRRHAQRALRRLLRAHGRALRRLAHLQLRGAGRLRRAAQGVAAQEGPRRAGGGAGSHPDRRQQRGGAARPRRGHDRGPGGDPERDREGRGGQDPPRRARGAGSVLRLRDRPAARGRRGPDAAPDRIGRDAVRHVAQAAARAVRRRDGLAPRSQHGRARGRSRAPDD